MDDATLLATYRDSLMKLDARARREFRHARPPLCGWTSFSRPAEPA